MTDCPELGARSPTPIEVMAGETYWWCAYGRSHESTSFTPLEWNADRTWRLLMCTRKRTASVLICDNSHLKL
jgi:CDGSH iron-sulfur domain-containing protein 3